MTTKRTRGRLTAAATAGLGAATLVLTTLTGASSSTASVLPDTAACDRAPWSLRVQGAPKDFAGGDRGGDYLWHDLTGFHLRVTHRADERVVYSGVIHSSAPMTMDPVRLEPGDAVTLSADRRTIAFAFANHGHVDGVDFHTACARALTVSRLNAGSHRLDPDRVNLGAYGRHPAHVPFTLHRIGAA
jgi:hypothetical protein